MTFIGHHFTIEQNILNGQIAITFHLNGLVYMFFQDDLRFMAWHNHKDLLRYLLQKDTNFTSALQITD